MLRVTSETAAASATLECPACHGCGRVPLHQALQETTGVAQPARREWGCSACGKIHDRYVNAAQNILRLGLSAQPPVVESRVSHGC